MPSTKQLGGNTISDGDPLQTADAAIAGGVDIVAVTQSDTADDPAGPFRGIAFAGVGIIRLITEAGEDRTIPSGVLAAGSIHALGFTRIFTTTTTATDIHGIV